LRNQALQTEPDCGEKQKFLPKGEKRVIKELPRENYEEDV
jgi:hypothetical protein